MQIIYLSELEQRKYELIGKILEGCLFIYPTDTIYGLGCDATNPFAVDKLRNIKKKSIVPFSIIPPSIDWIYENCEVNEKIEKELAKLPGPYTFILKLKNSYCIAPNVSYSDTIGIRIPDHEIMRFLSELNKPIITTCVNSSNDTYMKDLDDLNNEIEKEIEFIIYAGPLNGKPSKVINLITGEVLRD
ncbi:MAG: L-threonylcarbamoyladenylate synthase [Candidatus Woesearchaeota archaeon]